MHHAVQMLPPPVPFLPVCAIFGHCDPHPGSPINSVGIITL